MDTPAAESGSPAALAELVVMRDPGRCGGVGGPGGATGAAGAAGAGGDGGNGGSGAVSATIARALTVKPAVLAARR